MRSMSTAAVRKGKFISAVIFIVRQPTLWGRRPEQECYGLRLEVSEAEQGHQNVDWPV